MTPVHAGVSLIPDLCDPAWFPADYLASSDRFSVAHVDLDRIGAAPFLDRRLNLDPKAAVAVDPASVDSVRTCAPPSFLFHSAFCGSTLLARALHVPPFAVTLKEPSVLLSLSTASLRERTEAESGHIDRRLSQALRLLARPWAEGGMVLIKPTNQANRLLPRMLAAEPHAKGLLLYSSLREFIVSCFKKLPQAEVQIRWMAQHLLVGTRLSKTLGIPPFHQFSLPEACVFAWYAQMERYAEALTADHDDRLRSLEMRSMLNAPHQIVVAAASWLGLPADKTVLQAQVNRVFRENSKAPERQFDVTIREQEKKRVLELYGAVIDRTLEWAQSTIEPHCLLPEAWKPLEEPR